MAGAGYKLFNTGDVLTAAQVNTYLQQQTVMVFADSSARTTALSGVLAEGMTSYLQDTNSVEYYDGSAWVGLALPSQTGNSGKYLTTNGTSASWGTVASGGMTLIQETVANANSSISFGSIPSTYKQLLLVWSGIKHSAAGNSFVVRANNSGSIVCNYHTIRAVGSSTSGQNGSTTYGIGGNSIYSFGENASSVVAGYEFRAAAGWINIDDYASTSKYKSVRFNYGWQNDNTGDSVVNSGEGWLETTSAISSLDVVRITGTGTMSNLTNTSIRLYGVS